MICMQRRQFAACGSSEIATVHTMFSTFEPSTAARSRSFPSCKHYRKEYGDIVGCLRAIYTTAQRRKDVHGVLKNDAS